MRYLKGVKGVPMCPLMVFVGTGRSIADKMNFQFRWMERKLSDKNVSISPCLDSRDVLFSFSWHSFLHFYTKQTMCDVDLISISHTGLIDVTQSTLKKTSFGVYRTTETLSPLPNDQWVVQREGSFLALTHSQSFLNRSKMLHCRPDELYRLSSMFKALARGLLPL